MRHLGSFLVTILFAPAVYLLTGIGLVKFSAATGDSAGSMATAGAAGAILAAGILYAILTVSRLSPLGPFLAGLGYGVVAAWSLLMHESFTDQVPFSVLGMHGVLTRPAEVAGLMAIPLIATAFSPSRWRRDGDDEDAAYPGYQAAGYQQPEGSYQQPGAYPEAGSYQSSYDDPFQGYR